MTMLGIVDHKTNQFRWTIPSNPVKPIKLRKIEDEIAQKSAKYIRLANVIPLPTNELDELDDEIKHLQKTKERLLDEWKERGMRAILNEDFKRHLTESALKEEE